MGLRGKTKPLHRNDHENTQVVIGNEYSLVQVAQKGPDIRRPKSRGMKRTQKYAAMTKDKGNAIDGSASGRSAMPIFRGDSRRESDRKPLKELGDSVPNREPLQKLDEVERPERNLFDQPLKCIDDRKGLGFRIQEKFWCRVSR